MMSWDSQSRIVDMAVFDGVDVEGITAELGSYIEGTDSR